MARKLLIGGVLGLLALGAAAGIYYWQETKPVEVRGSASEEFDRSDTPGEEDRSRRERIAEPWPTFGYDVQRTKVSPYDHRPPFRQRWRIDAGDTLEFPASAAYGNVYAAQQKGRFFALNARTGRPVFKTKDYKRCAASSPTLANGTIYQAYMHPVGDLSNPCPQNASNPTGFLLAMNARTGRERWRFKAAPIESSPLLKDGVLYFGSWDQNVYAVDARTGRKIWSYQTDGKVNTSAAYAKGHVFIANDSGNVYALDAKTGKLAWQASSQSRFGSREFFYAAPAVAYGRVFIGNTDGTMFAFGARSGETLWARPLGTYIYSSAALYDRKVFVGTYDGNFFALDAATGDTKWEKDMPSAVHAPPTVMGGLVYATTCATCGSAAARFVEMGTDSTTAFDADTGRQVWRIGQGKYASPITADQDRMYLTARSFLFAFDPAGRGERPAKRREGRGASRRGERRRGAKRREAKRRGAKRRRAARRRR